MKQEGRQVDTEHGDQPAVEGTDDPAQAPNSESTPSLSDRERAILMFERSWWRHVGAKEDAIRREFAISPARYYQILSALIDSPLALAFDPMLIKRLQRMRDSRGATRAARAARHD